MAATGEESALPPEPPEPCVSGAPYPPRPQDPSWDSVAAKLVREGLLLTGLELCLELQERGRDLPLLNDYFSNPGNFEARTAEQHPGLLPRSSSQTTLDSLDWGRLSEDGERVGDERVAVLEFELRKARETIQGLRANLTQAAEQQPREGGGGVGGGTGGREERSAQAPPPPHERRTLNFLINEYLVTASYKLTAITFADENDDQDFEHWDDVGLNTSRPPSLVQLLREGGHSSHAQLTSRATQTLDPVEGEVCGLQEQLKDARAIIAQQERELQKLRQPLSPPPSPPQAEGHPTPAPAHSPMGGGGGRESPEGTSDSEGGGLVMVLSGAGAGEEEPSPAGYEDPSESIEALLETPGEQPAGILDTPDSGEGEGEGEEQPVLEGAAQGQLRDKGEVGTPLEDPPVTPITTLSMTGEGQHITQLTREARQLLRASSSRRPPEAFEERVLRAGLGPTVGRGGRVQEAVAKLGVPDGPDLVECVASSLHHIAPNVILAKREELVPLLVAGVSRHSSAGVREGLLHLLFNLIKRPDDGQRAAILTGLVGLARVLGPATLEAELLPQVWEQLAHRYPERRLLVALATAALAPHTPPPLRNSLLLSMLLQLLPAGPGGERDPRVREAALASLALLATFLDDPAKLPSLVEVVVQCVSQPSPGPGPGPGQDPLPSPRSVDLLLSALAMWGVEGRCLGQVVDPLLEQLVEQVSLSRQQGPQGPAEQAVVGLVGALGRTLPFLLASLITTLPGGSREQEEPPPGPPPLSACTALEELEVVVGGRAEAEGGLARLHAHLAREWVRSWPELDYLKEKVLVGLVEALAGLEVWAGAALEAFLALFTQLPPCLGPALTSSALTPLFLARLDGTEPEAVRRGDTGLTGPLAVVYSAALLLHAPPGELEGFLARQVTILGLCGAPTLAPHLALSTLMQAPRHQEAVLGALWTCVVHRSPAVRAATAGLWGAVVGGAQEAALGARVVPALVTLATDPDHRVKAATLQPLGTILTTATTQEVVDKVWLQLETLCDDSALGEQLPFQLALARTCTLLAHTGHPRLIQQFLLPRLCRVAVEGAVGGEVGMALLEAYSALTCCHLPDHVVAHFILPPLNQLQKTLGAASIDHMETITDLLREYTLRAQASSGLER